MSHVERPALNRILNDAETGRLCVLVGGAGWGKTTTLAAWAAQVDAAWVSLGRDDGDMHGLVRRLELALRPRLTEGRSRRALMAIDGLSPGSVAAMLEEAVIAGAHDPLTLVVDDLQELSSDCTSMRLLEALCRRSSDRLHLVVSSRRGLPFPLERLRGQGRIVDIDAELLAFDVADVAMLLEGTTGADAISLAAHIREATGGWPAAVRIAVESICGVPSSRRVTVLERLSHRGGWLAGYMATEALAGEPESVRRILRRVAALGVVDQRVCDVLGPEDPAMLLPELARRGLVEYRSGTVAGWALSRWARQFFLSVAPLPHAEVAGLHLRTARRLAELGEYGAALRHLLDADDHQAAVSLLTEHGAELLAAGEVDAVLAAAKLTPASLDDPHVLLTVGQAHQARGQWAAAWECFRRLGDEEILQPRVAWCMGLVPYARADFDTALEIYGRARLGQDDTADAALVLAWTAAAYRMTGQLERCREVLVRAAAAASRCREPRAQAAVHTVQAMLAAVEGNRADHDAYALSAVEAAERAGDALGAARARVNHALELVELGELTRGLREIDDVLGLDACRRNALLHAVALTVRGRATAQLDRLEEAVDDFDKACGGFQALGSRFLAWPLNGLGFVHRVRGDLTRARAYHDEALALAQQSRDAFGMSAALMGLARVRAADDPAAARDFADQAVRLSDGLHQAQALLARGWVALVAGDRKQANADGNRATALAMHRRDHVRLAEALELTALTIDDQARAAALADEAVELWRGVGSGIGEARAQLVAAHVTGADDFTVEQAGQELRGYGVHLDRPQAAGALAVVRRRAPLLSIRALGAFEVWRDGKPIPTSAWKSKKAREMLAILVARRRPVRREELMELLWPEVDPARSSNRLSVLLSTARDVLNSDRQLTNSGPLATDGHVVWLDRKQVDVDVERFLTTAAAALDAHARHDGAATDLLVAAEAVHRGDFHADDPDCDWATDLGEEVRATYIAVLRALAYRMREVGDIDRAVRYGLRLLAHDPYDEEAHLDLVRALLGRGHRGEAHRHYLMYARRMAEIDVEPRPYPGATRHG